MANDSQSRTARRNQKNNKGNRKPVFKKVLLALLITGIVLMIATGSLMAYYVSSAPELNKAQLSDPIPSRVYDMNGELFAELGSENRTKISYSELPDVMRDAVLATEDVRFFEHSGIDIRRIGGAVISNITSGFGSQGASTITQQVVKRSFLSPDKTLKRKVQEQWLAIKLEQQYSKEEIFEMYMNKIYYDSGAYGVAEAAETYYGITDLKELTLPQAALLAGLPQRPAAYNPIKNPEYAKERRDRVLDLMVHHDKISEQEAEEAKSVEIEEMLNPAEKRTNKYQAFLDQVQREVEAKLDGADIYEDGLRIYTTVEPKAQEKVEELLSKDSPLPFPDDELQTATTVVDTQTGAIRAIGGSRSEEAGGYNYAIQGGRQAGSTFKPIMAYGPVIENKKWSTYHQYDDDGPVEFPNGDVIGNYNDKYYGWVSMREALYRSLNNPAVNTMQEVGMDEAKSFAEGLGIEFKDDEIYPADAIGGAKTTATPKELAGAYAAFGNEGVFNEPYAVEKVVLPDDEELDLKPEPQAAMSKYTAYMITDMLKSVVNNDSGTGRDANIPDLPLAGKTGTTNSYNEGEDVTPDAWFNGYTTNYSISTWTGYGEGNARDIPGAGKDIPKQLFKSLMTSLSEGKDTKDFTMPETVKEVEVEKGSNPAKLPSDYTPDSEIVTELFHVDNMPSETSEEYDRLDPVKDLKAKYNKGKHVIDMSWNHDDDVSFEVSVSVDGSDERTITTTDKKSLEVTQINEGSTYKFTIRAVGDDSKSEGKSVEVTVPGGDEEQEEDTDEENQDEEENENEDQGQGNNGNGNGNGNNGNGRGNGNDDGDGDTGSDGDDGGGDTDGDGTDGGDTGDDDADGGDTGGDGTDGGDTGDDDADGGDTGGDTDDSDSNEDSSNSLLP
ncbi:penicillin-binding protein 1A/1B [Thalassobacillus devorans]|uniref:Penicillin-binding protein 1A/1B n=1 Tax=Thalassobacillus devorans TaxID=279813 RepID=A0ABQ1NYT7_9BACI|nr:PBP1A family penicillin-binding protein [Thalassobacillus devorans]NIK28271.1 penicillin-binding protein 1A [Thalassobacillus devorans]GGC87563.1 penicillin-binding protein 1A/1B [Thalassobacillus devorans]